jgi:hypothetical protein
MTKTEHSSSLQLPKLSILLCKLGCCLAYITNELETKEHGSLNGFRSLKEIKYKGLEKI